MEDDGLSWYGVRCVYRYPNEDTDTSAVGQARDIFEERVTVWRAASFDDAIAKAEEEGDQRPTVRRKPLGRNPSEQAALIGICSYSEAIPVSSYVVRAAQICFVEVAFHKAQPPSTNIRLELVGKVDALTQFTTSDSESVISCNRSR